jgi:CRP/FNR family transcriptional regulator
MHSDETRSIFDFYPALTEVAAGLQARIRTEMRPLRARDGQRLFRPGDRCDALPLIVAGGVGIIRPLPTGRIVPLYKVTPGEFCVLSISCLLADIAYPAVGRAAGDVVGAMLPKTLFRMLLDKEPVFRNAIFNVFTSRLCLLMALIEHIAVTTLEGRLADLLVSRGPVIHATHQALADELGTAREVVSRILEHFEDHGLVRLRRAHVDVINPDHLAREYATRDLG